MIPTAIILVATLGAGDQLEQIEQAVTDIDARRALLNIPGVPIESRAASALRAQLNAIERDLRQRLTQLDADERLLIDPDLRQRRSDLAVVDLRLRLPIARARLVAVDPSSDNESLRLAINTLNAIDYAWGEPVQARSAALGALLLRTGDFSQALDLFEESDGADPLVRLGRTACRAASGSLGTIPSDPQLLEAALFGAALGAGEITSTSALAERAIGSAPPGALSAHRETAYAALRTLATRHGARPPLVRVALADSPDDLHKIIDLPPSARSDIAAMEANWRLWTLTRDRQALLDTALAHPNPAARSAAATLCTGELSAAPPNERLAAKTLYDALPAHPHRPQWLLMYAEIAPVDDALRALDNNTDATIEPTALLLAARRAHEAFTDNPHDSSATNDLIRRADAARRAVHDPRWDTWLVRAIAEGTLAQHGALHAGRWLLAQPSEDSRAAAKFLAPRALDAALSGEAENNAETQREAASVAEQVALLANTPVIRARALVLEGRPEEALAALDGSPRSPDADVARAEAYLAQGRDETAFPLYRAIAESHEANRRDSDAYWRAWTRMLEIIDRREGADRREEIAREINRLRFHDKRLGGDPHRRRLESLLDRATPGTPPER